MYLSAEKKEELFSQYGKSNKDTGSAESQIALFSYRINRCFERTHQIFDRASESQSQRFRYSESIDQISWKTPGIA